MIKILIDAMGGDNAPAAPVQGAVDALNKNKNIYLILAGRQEDIGAELKKYKYDSSRLETMDCRDVIDMNDIPTEAVRKRESSLVKAFRALKTEDDIAGLVTAGSTGATIAAGQLILGRIRGVKRPALCPAIPNIRGGYTLLCDCGANAECTPEYLLQFAYMGSFYSKRILGVDEPRVNLLNIGAEECKGTPDRIEAWKALDEAGKAGRIDFRGNIEAREVMLGDTDVLVTDGFAGNIFLKTVEGTALFLLKELKGAFLSSTKSKLGALLLKDSIAGIKSRVDISEVGGTIMLGLRKTVVKAHGSSDARAIRSAVMQAIGFVEADVIGEIERNVDVMKVAKEA